MNIRHELNRAWLKLDTTFHMKAGATLKPRAKLVASIKVQAYQWCVASRFARGVGTMGISILLPLARNRLPVHGNRLSGGLFAYIHTLTSNKI